MAAEEDMEDRDSQFSGKMSELEERAWEEKKRVREKISSIMGQYLLKGYRMLNTNCAECKNILLQNREGNNYCIYCAEIAEPGGPGSVGSGQQDSTTASVDTRHPTTAITPAVAHQTAAVNEASKKHKVPNEHQVPTVCTGQTSDTFHLTTTPADHDTLTMCTATKRMRTNPAIIHTSTPTNSTSDLDNVPLNRAKQQSLPAKPVVPDLQSRCIDASVECQVALIGKLQWCTGELENTQSVEHALLLCKLITATGEALKTLQEVPTSPGTDLSMDT